MILLPMAAYMVGSALWCLVELTPWALFVPMAISSIGNGLSEPPALVAGLSVHPRIAGAASGLLGFLQMTVAALGTLLIGRLPHDSALAMVVVVVACLALALAFGLLALRRPPQPHTRLAPRGSVPRSRSDPDDLHSPT